MSEVPCERCNGLCCRYFILPLDNPETRGDFEYIRWYLLHENSSAFIEEGDWYLQVSTKCKALTRDNKCSIYEKRPPICKKYSVENCDLTGEDYEYEKIFNHPEEIESYCKEYLKKKYLKRKKKLKRRK